MKVSITGASGKVGQALIHQISDKVKINALDMPEFDARDREALIETTADSDTLIHLAWKDLSANFEANTVDPDNTKMMVNAYEAARTNGLRLIMASSNQAHAHDLRDKDGKVRVTTLPVRPTNPYGAEKLFMEGMGAWYSNEYNLEVVAVRIGNINEADAPREDDPTRWMSHRDWGSLVMNILEAEEIPDRFQIVYGVSEQEVFDWTNPFGYEPQDKS